MAIRIFPRASVTLPTGGAVLREPFSRGLVAAFAPGLGHAGVTDLVSGLTLTLSGGACLGTAGGTAGLICGAGGAASATAPDRLKIPFTGTAAVTLVARMGFFGAPVANNGRLFGVTSNNTGASPYLGYAFDTDSSGFLRLGYSSGALFREWNGGAAYRRAPAIGQPFTMVGVFEPTLARIAFGPDDGSANAVAPNPFMTSTSEIFLGVGTPNVCLEYG